MLRDTRPRLGIGVILLVAGIVCAALAYSERHDPRMSAVGSGRASCGSVSHPASDTRDTEECHDLLADRRTTALREIVGSILLLIVGSVLVFQGAVSLSGFEQGVGRVER